HMTLRLRYAARSDVGLVRRGNEDSGYASPRLLIVADGMGGHAAGELASATAVATLAHLELAPPQASDVLAALAAAIDNTGASIRAVIEADADLAGMGTTVTSLYWMGERIALVHVGDSRAYLMRGGELTQLTHDHTFVQTLIDAGRITEEEAAIHPRRSLIMRALDGLNPVEPDLSVREARVGDRYLLCSDGLSGVMSIDEIAERMRDGDPTGSVTRLVEFALERGAPDNVTVVIADVVDGDGSGEDNVIPVVVGAAGEPRVRVRLPNVAFPDDAQRDPDRADGGGHGLGWAAMALAHGQLGEGSARNRRRRWRLILVLGLLVAGTVITFLVTQNWLNSRWYVAINGSPGTGTIAIYNGIQGSMLGFDLSTVSVDSGLTVGSLPFFDQELVSKGIPASDETDAQRIVSELKDRAAACAAPFAPSGCPGVAP
ncbi:MAG: serine/threonine-protein phosphatase, partial [Actinobacteria bacterium]|nr:serine/threonine-protein phosphatase [Actinomycetota bacterium]